MSDEPIKLPEPDPGRDASLVDAWELAYAEKRSEETMQHIVNMIWESPWEVRLAVWCHLTAQGVDQLDKAKWVHRFMAAAILDIFGVPMGEAGIGVTPRKIIMWNDPVYSGSSK